MTLLLALSEEGEDVFLVSLLATGGIGFKSTPIGNSSTPSSTSTSAIGQAGGRAP